MRVWVRERERERERDRRPTEISQKTSLFSFWKKKNSKLLVLLQSAKMKRDGGFGSRKKSSFREVLCNGQ